MTMKKSLLLAAVLGFVTVPVMAVSVMAQHRADTTKMSCATARGIVETRGAIVLSTGEYTYDRFVVSQRYCERDEITKPAWVPTNNDRQCFVGYRCERVADEWPF